MTTTVNHQYQGNVYYDTLHSAYVFWDEKRGDEYSETSGQQSYKKTYQLQARDNPLTLLQAKIITVEVIKSQNLLTFDTFSLASFNLNHANEEDLDYLWDVELEWKSKENDSSGSSISFDQYKVPYTLNESFDTGGGTAHITQAYDTGTSTFGETIYNVDANDPAPSSFYGQIGWNGESAEGCDVVRPALAITLHKKMAYSAMTQAYRNNLALMTGRVNNATYYGFSKGNLLLEAVSCSTSVEYDENDITVTQTGDITWPYRLYYDLSFKFRGGVEFTNLPVGGVLINKKGHQYVWTYYEKYDDATAGVTFQKPKAVIVNDVYPEADFTQLNIFGEIS